MVVLGVDVVVAAVAVEGDDDRRTERERETVNTGTQKTRIPGSHSVTNMSNMNLMNCVALVSPGSW